MRDLASQLSEEGISGHEMGVYLSGQRNSNKAWCIGDKRRAVGDVVGVGGRLPLGWALDAIEEPCGDLEQRNDTV